MGEENKPGNEKPTPDQSGKEDTNRPPTSEPVLKESERPPTSTPTLRYIIRDLPAPEEDKKGE